MTSWYTLHLYILLLNKCLMIMDTDILYQYIDMIMISAHVKHSIEDKIL